MKRLDIFASSVRVEMPFEYLTALIKQLYLELNVLSAGNNL